MAYPLDPGLVFDRFVLGAGNRLAAAAARGVAEAPGRSYNPLLVTGAPGSGKTHLLAAIAHRAREIDPDLLMRYETTDDFVDRLTASIATGTLSELRDASARVGLWLFDDLQEIGGKQRSQEELFRLWERLIPRGAQVVVALDRPLAAVADLHPGLASRLARGLSVEIAPLDRDTRMGVVRQLARELQLALPSEALYALAGLPIADGRELDGALRRVAAAQLEGARIDTASIAALAGVGGSGAPKVVGEYEGFLTDVSTAVAAVVETAPWRRRLAEAILAWEGEGIRTRRLEAALDADSAPDVEAILRTFARDIARQRELVRRLPAPPEDPLLRTDPDRLPELEALAAGLPARPADGAAPTPLSAAMDPAAPLDAWFLDRARFAWGWVSLEERIVEDLR